MSGAAVALRARGDLVARPQTVRGRRCWCVKDPVSLAYFHLSDHEYALLRMLDGRATLASLRLAFERRSPGAAASEDQLRSFLGGLVKNGLVVSEACGGGGERLWQRRVATRAAAVRNAFPALLALRFRGIDPSSLLRALEGWIGWVFARWYLGLASALIVAAAVFAATRFDEFAATLPGAEAWFSAGNLAVLFLTIGGVKVFHELGHALTCRRLGGECHELGLMLLVFAPCLYCDVSDSWLFPRKRDRIAVAAAGIAVELLLAAIATFGWWFSEPGLFHAICMNVMVVCSLNTFLLNGNPLLRYDGYFVLSDLLEIPNLAAEARAAVTRLLFGRADGDPRLFDEREPILLTYGLLSAAYRVFLTWVIAWMVLTFLKSVGLAPLGYLFMAACAVGLVAGPIVTTRAALASPRRGRAVGVMLAAGALVALAAVVPLPRRVEAAAVLQPSGAHRVYTSVGGTLIEAAPPGLAVQAGQTLGRLVDAELEREIAELEGRLAELGARLQSYESRRLDDPTVAGELTPTREAIDGAKAQLESRRRDQAALRLTSPVAGTVLPPPDRPASNEAGEPAEWSGSPLEARNLGCFLEPGTLFCAVGEPGRIEAALYVTEDQVEAVRKDQTVRLALPQAAGRWLAGTVEAVAADPLRVVPPELATAGTVPVRTGNDGVVRPVETLYEVRVRLTEAVDAESLRIRGVGRAKVSVAPMTAGERLRRFLGRTFRFDL